MASKQQELVGVAEIAQLAGVSRQVVNAWKKRSRDMPQPVAVLKMGPVWDAAAIRKWLIRIGFTHLQ